MTKVVKLLMVPLLILYSWIKSDTDVLADINNLSANEATFVGQINPYDRQGTSRLSGKVSERFILAAKEFDIYVITYRGVPTAKDTTFYGHKVIGRISIKRPKERLKIIRSLKINFQATAYASGCIPEKGYALRIKSSKKILDIFYAFESCQGRGYEYDAHHPTVLLRTERTDIAYPGKLVIDKILRRNNIKPPHHY